MKLILPTLILVTLFSFSIYAKQKAPIHGLIYKLKNDTDSFKSLRHSFIHDEIASFLPLDKQTHNIYQLKQELDNSGLFEFVEFNTDEYMTDTTSRPTKEKMHWQHKVIKSFKAWKYTMGKNTIIAVCDSGVSNKHLDLTGNVLAKGAFNFDLNQTGATPDISDHGTMVAGIIAAKNNNIGIFGIAPKVKILPLKITNPLGISTTKKIIQCIKYAADFGARVINISFTGINKKSIQSAAKYAMKKNALVVYSAGNHGKEYLDWKNSPYLLAVGAIDINKNRWSIINQAGERRGSNRGPFIDLVAPGSHIYSTSIKSPKSYRFASGTSFAAPMVSAAAALVFAATPKLSASAVYKKLKKSAHYQGDENSFGAGILNTAKSLMKE